MPAAFRFSTGSGCSGVSGSKWRTVSIRPAAEFCNTYGKPAHGRRPGREAAGKRTDCGFVKGAERWAFL